MPLPFTKLVQGLPESVPFVGPETHERQRGKPFAARIGANESVFGPSPNAVEAMCAAAADVWKYCDAENYDLKQALARHHGVGMDNIVIGEGIDGLLGLVVRLFVEQGDAVATSAGAYPTFNYHVAGFGGELIKVPYANDHENPDALIDAAAASGAKLVYIANPDNPMGTAHKADVIAGMIARAPGDAVLCLDEAYLEFADPDIAPPLDVSVPNLIRFRTFSKAYGMAGARVGYAIAGTELVRAFDKVRNHFGVNRIAQAGALAALEDQAYLRSVQDKVEAARIRIGEIAAENGLSVLPSQTNFVAVDCGRDGTFAKRVLDHLVKQGVFVRMPGVAPLDRCIRVSAGTEADLDIFASELPNALQAASDAD